MDFGANFFELPLWGFALGVPALVLAALAVWLLRKTRLFYGIPIVTPLLNASPVVRDRLLVTMGGVELKQPHTVKVEVITRGLRDIDARRPLVLDVGARIFTLVEPLRVEPADADRPEVTWADTALRVEPCVIKGRERISLSLLVDGESPRVARPTPNLSDVVIREFTGQEPPFGPWPLITSWLVGAAIVLTIVAAEMHAHAHQVLNEAGWHILKVINGWLIILALASLVTTPVLRRLARRR